MRAANDYPRGIEGTLKAQVYEALRHLAQGFLDYSPNGLEPDPVTLEEIYDNSLIVLYRLLFILYGESRELLPLRESASYRQNYSLDAIKHQVAEDLGAGRVLLADSDILWPRLKGLFRIIDRGNAPLSVATFNGGLFDPDRHPFIESNTVGDAHLQQAVDKLARVGGRFVDYRDLAERHLGTIYEGLLEFHLEALPESSVREGWTVDLLNDKGERRVTGSYYTPDHVVKYIVDECVGPAMRRAARSAEGAGEGGGAAEAVLALNIIDPAMGSGHFLVEATEYVARFLVGLGAGQDPAADAPSIDGRGPENGAELAYWKRRVVQSCIYGVDLNPLAVELAKLSLWLATAANDRPLSFLDHHLRCGNSLVGADLGTLHVYGGGRLKPKASRSRRGATSSGRASDHQPILDESAFRGDVGSAVGSVEAIEASPAETLAQVKEQEKLYEELHAALTEKYGRLADLATAVHYGAEADPSVWASLADYATGRSAATLPQYRQWLDAGATVAAERRFFHWELEFPEVFFGRDGRGLGEAAGFDAVVGNPPYISVTNIEKADRAYLLGAYEAATGRFDAYIAFLEKALLLTAKGGLFGYIVPIKFAIYANGLTLREMLLDRTRIRHLVNVSQAGVFRDPSTYPCVLVVEKREPDANVAVMVSNVRRTGPEAFVEDMEKEAFILPYERIRRTPERVISPALDDAHWALLERARSVSDALEEDFEVEQCIRIGSAKTRDELVVDDLSGVTPGRRALAHPVLDGEELGTFRINWQGKYLIYDKEKLYNPKTPAVLDVPKVLLKRVAPSLMCCPDEGTGSGGFYYPLNTVYALVPKAGEGEVKLGGGLSLFYLAALLNGRLLDGLYKMLFEAIGIRGGYIEFREFVRHLPIRKIRFATPAEDRGRLLVEGRELYARFGSEGDPEPLLRFVGDLLPRLPDGAPDAANERGDVVHDLLDDLGRRMVALNERRREAIEDFVLDLEGVLPAKDLQKIGRLWTPPKAPKPDAKDYEKKLAAHAALEAEARELLGPLSERRIDLREDAGGIAEAQWKWLLKHRLKKVSGLADLVRVYRDHRPSIAALEEEISGNLGLIDRVVYALYGLDEEEIALVEGTGDGRI